ncbi:MAG TPA: tape measure protein [Candidatus Parabacteroides intestinigallinarum]|uniref:Tape measure protein n=1 Tax=Candidatus Parabacteroides intestinigallinarum TaxID=2838722 RepID=A0A9D2BQW0_9BACT|nr:tape measure protein [Candidatus Parabacteroides intestinigallinarum]
MATKPVEIEILMRDRLSGGLDKAGRKVDELKVKTGSASAEMARLDRQAESVRGTVSKIAGAFAVKELVSNIVKVRGEFQQLEASFNTMLGSEEKADALMQQLIRTAATTPFDLQSVAGGARQLLAYGENVENVNEDLIRLGNIAAGLNQPLSDLIYLYGTTMTQGRLYTADYNQFVGRGIPLGRELANVLGVAEGKVREMVEAGKVGFPEVQQALQNLTNEGGMFYNLMEEQSKTITGRISNIEDSIGMMMNEIGRQSEGIIGNSLDAVAYLVDHYEQVGRVLLGLVGTYGAYKTAVMAVTAMQALQTAGVGALTVAETLHYGWLVIVEKAQKLLNATMLANPYVLVATLVAGVVAAMVSMKTETERLKEAEEEYQAAKQKTIEAEEEHRRRLEELCGVAGDESLATDTRREALNKLEQKYPDIFAKYDTEYEKLKNIKRIKEEIAELEAGQSITRPQNELASVNARITALEAKKATERWEDANGSGTRMRKVGGLTGDEATELQNLYNKRKALSEQVRKERANSYFENLTGISNDTLEQQIRQRENLLARMTTEQKKYGNITYGNEALRGTFSRDELQYQLNKLNAEKNRRNLKRDSSADWGAQARKEYEQALKAYNDFLADTSNSLTQEEYEKKTKELKDALSLAKKEYDRYKPDENKDAESERKAADKAEKEAERRRQAQQKLDDELITLEQQNQQDELDLMDDGTDKKLAQIDTDYEKRKAEIAKKARELADTNRQAGVTDVNAFGLTKQQQDEIDRANALNEDTRKKETVEVYEAEAAAMRDYLKEYGTYQQRKLAIAQEYAERIRKAQNDGERMALKRQRDSETTALDVSYLKQSIDWTAVFGEFGGMFSDIIRPALEQAKAYMQTDEFKRLDPSSQNDLVDAVRQMEQSSGGSDKASFRRLGTEIDSFRQSMLELNNAKLVEAEALERLREAQEDYEQALRDGSDAEIEAARTARDTAQENADSASESVRTQEAVVSSSQRTVTNTASTLRANMENVTQGLQRLSSAGIKNAYDGLIQLGKGTGGVLGDIADSLEKVPIVGWIVSIIDVFKDGLSNFIGPLLDSIFNAVSGIIGDVLSGDLFKTVGESLVKGVGGILDAITFGGFSSWFGSGESDPHLEEDIERLSATNEALADAIEALTEELKESSGVKAVELYEKQMADLAASEANTNEMMRRSAGASSNGFLGIGGHHSTNYKINEAMSAEEWRRVSEAAGRTVGDAGAFWTLTSEEMLAVAREVPDLYAKIKAYADDGYKDAAQYMDDYIAFAEQREELEQAYYESLTQVSFDSVYDSFLDMLMDMDASWEDMADDMSEYLMRALLKTKLDEQLKPEMEEWYKSFGEAMTDGILSEDERNALSDWWDSMMEKGLSLRDNAAAATGYTGGSEGTTQSGKAGSFSAMSQEQGTKLEGLFTSGQMHWASIDEQMQDVSEQMGTAVDHLRRIEENTGNSARHLDEIKNDIKKIIRDGLKMK